MKIAILGFDRQGKSAFDYWSSPDNTITICDRDPFLEAPAGVEVQLGPDYLKNLAQFDLLVRTPGLHPKKIKDATPDDPDILDKVTTVTNEFFEICPTNNIIGITGTKGKGTTATILTAMLTAAGKRVHLGGNIGIPPLELLRGVGLYGISSPGKTEEAMQPAASHLEDDTTENDSPSEVNHAIQPDDWVVLELANFQLIDLQYAPHIAVCLMVVPEHLDWHENFDEYLRAKQQLFAHQTEDDIAVYHGENNRSAQLAASGQATQIPYLKPPGAYLNNKNIRIDDQVICSVDDVPLPGEHNLENVCAAATAAWQIAPEKTALADAIKNMKSLPHRLELTAEVNGVAFFNDSLGTTPETAIAAIQAMDRPTIIILGGSDKGAEFEELAKTIAQSDTVKHTVLIGKTGPAIERALTHIDYDAVSYGGDTMVSAVQTAYERAETGDAVLLSPACASFDMFYDYADRGDQFSQAVRALDQAG